MPSAPRLTPAEKRWRKVRREHHLKFCRWYLDTYPIGKRLAEDIRRELAEAGEQQTFLTAAKG
jgi:hypothetical protein